MRQLPVAEAIFFMYVNEPAVVIGRNQNLFAETNPTFLAAGQIHLVRRLSGGGTVYHDAGNLNFGFIVPGREHIHDFGRFTEPVVRLLDEWGLPVQMGHNGSLFIGEEKISGHAQYASANRLLSHGTLLFDADLKRLPPALAPHSRPVSTNAVPSIRSPVCNLRPLLPAGVSLASLQQALLTAACGPHPTPLLLAAADWARIEALADGRYRTWEWIYGRNPRFVLERQRRFPGGSLEVQVEVEHGVITNLSFSGGLARGAWPAALARQLTGSRYETAVLAQLGHSLPPVSLPSAPTLPEILSLII